MERTPFSCLWSHLFDRLPQRRNLALKDRHRLRRSLIFSLHNLTFGFACLLYLLPLVFRNREISSSLFLRAEILSILLLALMSFDVWHLLGHRPKAWSLPGNGEKMFWFPAAGNYLRALASQVPGPFFLAHKKFSFFSRNFCLINILLRANPVALEVKQPVCKDFKPRAGWHVF